MTSSSHDNWGCGCLFLIAILCAGGWAIYEWSDSAGYVPHTQTVDLYMKGEWLVGENRTCTGFQKYPDGQSKPPQLGSLDCADDSTFSEKPHNMSIKFWGKVSRPDMMKSGMFLSWQCTRTSDGFVCKALN